MKGNKIGNQVKNQSNSSNEVSQENIQILSVQLKGQQIIHDDYSVNYHNIYQCNNPDKIIRKDQHEMDDQIQLKQNSSVGDNIQPISTNNMQDLNEIILGENKNQKDESYLDIENKPISAVIPSMSYNVQQIVNQNSVMLSNFNQQEEVDKEAKNIKKIVEKHSNKMVIGLEVLLKNPYELSPSIEEQEYTKRQQELSSSYLGELYHQREELESKKLLISERNSECEKQLNIDLLVQKKQQHETKFNYDMTNSQKILLKKSNQFSLSIEQQEQTKSQQQQQQTEYLRPLNHQSESEQSKKLLISEKISDQESEYQLIIEIIALEEENNQQKQIQSKAYNLSQIFQVIAQLNKRSVRINQIIISVGNKQSIIPISKDQSKLILHQIRANKIQSLKLTLDNLTFKMQKKLVQMQQIELGSITFFSKIKNKENNIETNSNNYKQKQLNELKKINRMFISNRENQLEKYYKGYQQFYSNLQFQILKTQQLPKEITNKLLGGGSCCSKQNENTYIIDGNRIIDNNEEILQLQQSLINENYSILKDKFVVVDDNVENNSSNNDGTFEEFYQKYYKNIKPECEGREYYVRKIIEKIHGFRECIVQKSRSKMIDIFNLVMNFLLIILNDTENIQQVKQDIENITAKLRLLETYCKENRNRYPSLDLLYYFETLISLNEARTSLDEANKSKSAIAWGKFMKFVKIGAGLVSIKGAIQSMADFKLDDIKTLFDQAKELYSTVKKPISDAFKEGKELYQEYSIGKLIDKIQNLWLNRINSVGNDMIHVFEQYTEVEKIEEETQYLEIFFYLEEILKMADQNSEDIVLFALMQLNYLLAKLQSNDPKFELLSREIESRKKKNLIIEFVNLLQLRNISVTDDGTIIQFFVGLIFSNTKFRYIRILLMLKFAQILEVLDLKIYYQIMVNLCTSYLQEKDFSVNIVFGNNQNVAKFLQKKDEYKLIITESKRLREQFTRQNSQIQINAISNEIESDSDIQRLIAIKFAQMWEASVKQRQDSNKISHKDDALLEALSLYIKQYLTYEQGYKFSNNSNKTEDIYLEQDAVKIIIDYFLIPNFKYHSSEQQNEKVEQKEVEVQRKLQEDQEVYGSANEQHENEIEDEEKEKQQEKEKTEISNEVDKLQEKQYNHTINCKIVSILAEGGSGKSMLLKKLEVELLKEIGESEYRQDEKSNYLPFIIKCNQLDSANPSIENYLQSQNLSIDEIEMLKSSEKNKLIMLDGYDEYSGDYFKVYQVLRLFEWVNTLVIVSSRLEKISVSDAKIYFNYYDQEGQEGSDDCYATLKLNKMENKDIKNYLKMFKDQKTNGKHDFFNSNSFEKLESNLFENNQLIELLKLPINLYLITRMMADLNDDENTLSTFQSATDQVEIQELFFQQQFKKQAQIFIEKQQLQKNNEKQRIIEKIQQIFFEYFQTIAMLMFIQKGEKSNFLSTTRDSIKFSLQEVDQLYLQKNKIKTEHLIQNLNNYVDSRVITKSNQASSDNNCEEFEFRHKSLFEYFAARAMKYDFDVHQENIFQMDISALSQFNINKRIIMSRESNASEYQILLKLYKLIKPDIYSLSFMQNYAKSDPSETNRYIQYLRKSKISKITEASEIDVGSSNLLSALFVSKFSFPQLIFKKCSFSYVYISSEKVVDFELCNLQNSYLGRQQLEFFESSNTKYSIQDQFIKVFDQFDDLSNDVLICGDTLYSITKNGYIHKYKITRPETFRKLQSNKFSSARQECKFSRHDKIQFLIVLGQKSFFEIDKETLEVINYFKFPSIIKNIQTQDLQYIVTLENQQQFEGNFVNGFKIKNGEKLINEVITRNSKEISFWKAHLNEMYEYHPLYVNKDEEGNIINIIISASFSKDGNYLSVINEYKVCRVYDIQNSFQNIKTQFDSNYYNSCQFSSDSKYLILIEMFKLDILNINQGFKLEISLEEEDNINSAAFSPDSNYFVVEFEENSDFKIYDVMKEYLLIYQNNCKYSDEFYLNSVNTKIKATFSSDGRYLLTQTNLWNVLEKFKPVQCMDFIENHIYQAYFLPDTTYLFTIRKEGEEKQYLQKWDIHQEFKLLNTIGFDSSLGTDAILSPNCKILLINSQKVLQIRNVEKGLELINIMNLNCELYEFSHDSKYLATDSHKFEIWYIEKGFNRNLIENPSQSIPITQFSLDGKNLFLINDRCCQIFQTDKNFELVSKFEFKDREKKKLFISKDCQYLAILQLYTDNFEVYDLQNQFKLIQEIKCFDGYSKIACVFSKDNKLIVAIYEEKQIQIYKLEKQFEKTKVLQTEFECEELCFSPDCRYLVAGCFDFFQMFDINNEYQFTIINDWEPQLQFSSDSKYLSYFTSNHLAKLIIYNTENQFKQSITVPKNFEMKFSLDNKLFVVFSCDNMQIFELEKTIKLIKNVKFNQKDKPKDLGGLDISPDNKYISTYSCEGICKIWDIQNIDQPEEQSQFVYSFQ